MYYTYVHVSVFACTYVHTCIQQFKDVFCLLSGRTSEDVLQPVFEGLWSGIGRTAGVSHLYPSHGDQETEQHHKHVMSKMEQVWICLFCLCVVCCIVGRPRYVHAYMYVCMYVCTYIRMFIFYN